MPNWLLDLVACMPSELLAIYAATWMLTLRWPGWYWTLRVAGIAAITATRAMIPPPLIVPLALGLYVGITVACTQGSLVRRLVVATSILVCIMIGEVAGTAWWFVTTGLPVGDYDIVRANLGAFVGMHVLHLAVLALLFGILKALVGRVFDKDKAAVAPAMVRYTMVPLLQIPFLYLALGIQRYLLPDVGGLYSGNCLLVVAFLGADVALFWSLGRSRDQALAAQRSALLAEELDRSLAAYDSAARSLQQTARVRHDFRNQAQVVLSLAADGRLEEARMHGAALADLVRGTQKEAVDVR